MCFHCIIICTGVVSLIEVIMTSGCHLVFSTAASSIPLTNKSHLEKMC